MSSSDLQARAAAEVHVDHWPEVIEVEIDYHLAWGTRGGPCRFWATADKRDAEDKLLTKGDKIIAEEQQ